MATDYRQKSDSLFTFIKNQISEFGMWSNVPGSLKSISSSGSGYVWGIEKDQGGVWYCKEPCSDGLWKKFPTPTIPLDIATDSQFVYILYETNEEVNPSKDILKDDIVIVRAGNYYIGTSGLQTSPLPLRVAYITGSQIGFKTQEGNWITALPSVPGAFGTAASYPDSSPRAWELFGWDAVSPLSTYLLSAHGNLKITNESTGEFAYGVPPTLFSITKQVTPTTVRKKKYARAPVDGSGSWEIYDANGDGINLEVSDSFLFLGKRGCAKPCTTGNWVDVTQPGGTGINQGTFSASAGNVYNIQFENGVYKVYKGTGTGQGGWVEVPGLRNKIPLSTSIDNKVIYATPTDPAAYGTLERCSYPYENPDSCKKINTDGRLVSSVSVNPSTNRVWMTTRDSASKGNIFQKLDEEDANNIIRDFDTRSRELDRDVNSLGGEIRITQSDVTAGLTRKEASKIVKDATNLSGNISGAIEESEKLRSQIRQGKRENAGYKNKMLPIQILTFTLAVVLLVYLTAGFLLPSYVTSVISVLGLAGGLGAAIYFAVRNK